MPVLGNPPMAPPGRSWRVGYNISLTPHWRMRGKNAVHADVGHQAGVCLQHSCVSTPTTNPTEMNTHDAIGRVGRHTVSRFESVMQQRGDQVCDELIELGVRDLAQRRLWVCWMRLGCAQTRLIQVEYLKMEKCEPRFGISISF